MNKFNYTNLTPFKWFVLENFPFVEANFDALTEWQLFCKLGKEINKIINSENTLGTQVENFTNAFIDLQNYVNNYFKNLDVQEEINNKLNEMAQDGTLTNLIEKYMMPFINEQNGKISQIENKVNSVASGSPASVYDTLQDLQSADPDHSRIYVVIENGNWYYYNNSTSQWTSGGKYQSTGVGTGEITFNNLDDFLKNEIASLENKNFYALFVNKNAHNQNNNDYNQVRYFVPGGNIISIQCQGNSTDDIAVAIRTTDDMREKQTFKYTSNSQPSTFNIFIEEDSHIYVGNLVGSYPILKQLYSLSKINNYNNLNEVLFNNNEYLKADVTVKSTTESILPSPITCFIDISSFSQINSVDIDFDFMFLSQNLYSISSRFRSYNPNGNLITGTSISLQNDNIKMYEFNHYNFSYGKYSKTSNLLQFLIYPQLFSNNSDTKVSFLIKNLVLKINGTIVPINYNQFEGFTVLSANFTINKIITEKELPISILNNLHNKKYLCIGDSISSASPTYASKYYFDYLVENEKVKLTLDGKIGTGYTMGFSNDLSIPDRIKNYPSTINPDLISIFAGTNDWYNAYNNSIPLGSINDNEDSNTFYGYLIKTFNLLENKFINSNILIVTPIKRNIGTLYNGKYVNSTAAGYQNTLEDYAKAIIEVANIYSFKVLDLYNDSGLAPRIDINRENYFYDNTHPNDKGQEKLYPLFKASLLSIQY